jgi:hypothetical protein
MTRPAPSTQSKLKKVAEKYHQLVHLGLEKAALHLKHPKEYPLPSGANTLEKALVDVVEALAPHQKKRFLNRMEPHLKKTATQRKQEYENLADINLHLAKPLLDQFKELEHSQENKITNEEWEALIAERRSKIKPAVRSNASDKKKSPRIMQPQQAVAATNLQVFIDSLTCNQTSELRRDEISLSTFIINFDNIQQDKEPFFVGKFKNDETINLDNSNPLFDLLIDNSSVGGGFPANFTFGAFLLEKDWFRNTNLADKLSSLFMILGVVVMTISLVTLFISAIPFAVPLILWILGGVLFNLGALVFDRIFDDVGEVALDVLQLDEPPLPGITFSRTINLTVSNRRSDPKEGSYTATLRWVTV